jgi:hypothetical protein
MGVKECVEVYLHTPNVFMAWCLVNYGENFTLPVPYQLWCTTSKVHSVLRSSMQNSEFSTWLFWSSVELWADKTQVVWSYVKIRNEICCVEDFSKFTNDKYWVVIGHLYSCHESIAPLKIAYGEKKLCLYLTKHHAMKAYCGGGIAPRILDIGNRKRWVVSFTPRPFHPGERAY